MTTAVERIREEASHLPYEEREALVQALELDLATATSTEEDPGEIEAAWSADITERMRDLGEGRTAALSAQESNRRIDLLFSKHGVSRSA